MVIAIPAALTPAPKVVLASGSRARATLLANAGISAETLTPNVEEESIMRSALESGANAAGALIEIAKAKAQTVAATVDPTLVIAADSMLEYDGELIGKPHSPADVVARWSHFRGKSANLITAHVLKLFPDGRLITDFAVSKVNFAQISDAELEEYARTSEPLMAAGAFTLEGLGSAFIQSIEGSASNVQGLSLPLLRLMAKKLGIEWVSLWTPLPRINS